MYKIIYFTILISIVITYIYTVYVYIKSSDARLIKKIVHVLLLGTGIFALEFNLNKNNFTLNLFSGGTITSCLIDNEMNNQIICNIRMPIFIVIFWCKRLFKKGCSSH